MENKSLFFGIIGFILGGLLVSIAATTFNKPSETGEEMSMSAMTSSLSEKSGDDYDRAFVEYMIEHHQAAVDMAKLSDDRAKHAEIKNLSSAIVSAQEKEIAEMKEWQKQWGYPASTNTME